MVKKRSPQMIIFWFFFSCISLIFWSTISHLSFFGIVAAQFFSDAVDLFLEMFYKKHNIFFVGGAKKGSLDFKKKNSSIFKKREKTQKLREK